MRSRNEMIAMLAGMTLAGAGMVASPSAGGRSPPPPKRLTELDEARLAAAEQKRARKAAILRGRLAAA